MSRLEATYYIFYRSKFFSSYKKGDKIMFLSSFKISYMTLIDCFKLTNPECKLIYCFCLA